MEAHNYQEKEKEENIKVIVKFETKIYPFIYNINEKIEKLMDEFSKTIGLPKDFLLFLSIGKPLKGEEAFSQLKNNFVYNDKQLTEVTILVFRKSNNNNNDQSNNIKIILIINSVNEIDLQETKDETFGNIIKKAKIKSEININNFDFFYKGNKLDFDKKFDDIADEEDKNLNQMIIEAKERRPTHLILKSNQNSAYHLEENNKNKYENYSSENQLYKGNLIHIRRSNIIKNGKAFGPSYVEEPVNQANQTNITTPGNDTIANQLIDRKKLKNKNEISFFKKYKKCIIILSVILIVIIIGIIILVITMKSDDDEKKNINTSSPTDRANPDEPTDTTIDHDDNKDTCEIGEEEKCLTCDENKKECKACNIGFKLVEGKCKTDYFMKVVYFTKQENDKIEIINDYSDVAYMFIEGKNITPTNCNYQFKEEGYQTVYFQFEEKMYYTSKLFKNNKHIKSVVFSDFNEYQIGIQLNSMFAGCIELTSVDFSKLSYTYESDTKYILEKIGTPYMFDGCINLKYINIKNLKALGTTSYMFNNCKSLTSIDLSNFDISNIYYFDNMFSNCTSLQSINLKGFKLDFGSTIESMFKNCYSLKYLDLSAFKPLNLKNMNSAFYNCSSLTSINFLDLYSDVLTDIGYLFYNCSSLKEINIIDFNTKNVNNMQSMFEGCTTLTSIIIGSNFEINSNLEYIDSMFSRCHSLTSINFDIIITDKIESLSYLFSDCHSLTSINLINFDTSSVKNFDYMFHNCYKLKNIDITNFKINQNANLKGMFSGCYLITSIDFSNIESNYYQFDEIFYDCPNLNYVDFSFIRVVPYYYFYRESYYLFNKNISKSGTLILNEEYYNKYLEELEIYPPDGWTLNLSPN